MSIEPGIARSLLRVLHSAEERFAATGVLLEAAKTYNLGRAQGKSICYGSRDRREIRDLLTRHGYDANASVDVTKLSRSDRLQFTPYEKGGLSVKHNRIVVKSLRGTSINLATGALFLPPSTDLTLNFADLFPCLHDCIIVVENYENFNHAHAVEFDIPYKTPLLVYRGDQMDSRADYVLEFLRLALLPVLAYVDLDPSGLVSIARGLPGLVGVLGPRPEVLHQLFSSAATRRDDLYNHQYAQVGAVLEGLGQVEACWPAAQWLLHYRTGLVQERWSKGSVLAVVSQFVPQNS